MCVHLGPAALFAQQVGVVVRLLPLLLVGVSPHQLPVTQVVDLFPLLLAADTLLVHRPGLQDTKYHTHNFTSLCLVLILLCCRLFSDCRKIQNKNKSCGFKLHHNPYMWSTKKWFICVTKNLFKVYFCWTASIPLKKSFLSIRNAATC